MKEVICEHCNGTGKVDYYACSCPNCEGGFHYLKSKCEQIMTVMCRDCHGTGEELGSCPHCYGRGKK